MSVGPEDEAGQGESDPLDAVSAARAAQSGRASGAPTGRDGAVEAIRALMVAKRSARNERTQASSQARSLIVAGPDELRARFTRHTAGQLAGLAATRPRPGDVPGYAARVALRELGRRARFPRCPDRAPGRTIVPLVTARAPGLLALHGAGADTAALLLIAAGDPPARLRPEAAWAHLCGAAPIPASSGKVTRWRLNPGGNREARARGANPWEAGAFGIPDATIVLVTHATLYDRQRRPVEHSRYTWPTDAVRISDYYTPAAAT